MRVLLVCHRFPYPPQRGGKIRPFNIIRHLSNRHEVTVASVFRSAEEAAAGAGLSDHCAKIIAAPVGPTGAWARMLLRLPTRSPSSPGYFHAPALARQIRQEIASTRFDLIFVHCSSVAHYVADVQGTPKILDFGDMDSQKWLAYSGVKPFPLSLGFRLEGRKLEREERALARRFDCCTCTTRAELETLNDFDTGARTDWFPNGVDAQRFGPTDEPYDPDTICFVGRMDYFPNQECMFDFCSDVLPRIRERRPAVKLLIVGADPSPRVRRLAELPGVTVTGSVPEVQPLVRRAALTVAPLRIARGTQNKILESLAMGVPVVCSTLAARGVDAIPDEHLLTADAPDALANAILALLDDPSRRRRFSEAGRARMLSHHSWSRSMVELDRIVEGCLAVGAGAARASRRSAR